jgi:hypothetical protein
MHVWKQACEYTQETTLIHECLSFAKCKLMMRVKSLITKLGPLLIMYIGHFPHA